MFLLIFESLGTSELILIGIVALIFLGPRKLPLMARKVGKMMAEFRASAGEFRETWAREVNFEEEAKLLNIQDLDADLDPPEKLSASPGKPVVRQLDPEKFEEFRSEASNIKPSAGMDAEAPASADDEGRKRAPLADDNDKANWL
jgi:sec-independent protein translocase protein TatB